MADTSSSPGNPSPSIGFPENAMALVFDGFETLNTKPSRPAIAPQEMYICDGFMPFGKSNLRALYGVGPSIYTAPTGLTIVMHWFGNINTTRYCLVFLSDGSLVVVNEIASTATTIAPAGTITSPSPATAGVTQWGNKYFIIVSTQTNGYFIWDGATFYVSGGPAPGGGTMPTGISGSYAEVYQNQVWVANGANIEFSAPGSPSDFSPTNGAGAFTNYNSNLRVQVTALKSSNGFLYTVADSSLSTVSGVSTSGTTTAITTFSNQVIDPQTGTIWPGSVQVFSRNIVFANSFGVHMVYGGAAIKVSAPLDGIYSSVPNLGTFSPSAAMAVIFGIPVYMLLMPIVDQVTGRTVNKLLMWDSKRWWTSSQEVNLTWIATQEINSVMDAWGTDGTSIYPLFHSPSAALSKTVQSKLFDQPGYFYVKMTNRVLALLNYKTITSQPVLIAIDNGVNVNTPASFQSSAPLVWSHPDSWTNSSGQPITWAREGLTTVVYAASQAGNLLGITVQTQAPDLDLLSVTAIVQNYQTLL